jgi:tRNA A-37 threonylcarbamoyl transferase component Bud32
MEHQTIAQGAEAIIYKIKDKVVKDRIKKSYRIPELDNKIRKRRTKKEIKLLTKASSIINCPLPSKAQERIPKIIMPFIKGQKLSQHLNEFSLTKQKQILKQIGQNVSKLHAEDIIHGDLTTSNMILVTPSSKKISHLTTSSRRIQAKQDSKPHNCASAPIIYFIDFGLGYISRKIEDKAVDIHLLRQALEAKHFEHWEDLFKEFIKGYKSRGRVGREPSKVLERLKVVEKRGRYKH